MVCSRGKGRFLVLGGWSLAFAWRHARERRFEDPFPGSLKIRSLLSLSRTHSLHQKSYVYFPKLQCIIFPRLATGPGPPNGPLGKAVRFRFQVSSLRPVCQCLSFLGTPYLRGFPKHHESRDRGGPCQTGVESKRLHLPAATACLSAQA